MEHRISDTFEFIAESSDAETEKDTGLFIEQVDIVERLVTSISELCASGHFRFAKFDRSLSGLHLLQVLARSVDQELQEWYAATKQARSSHYCLNYFRSMELRLLLQVSEFFSGYISPTCYLKTMGLLCCFKKK
jgi:hypothetical protein